MSKKRQYKSYSQEFKEEAVALATKQGYSVPDAAASLGVRSWKKKQEESKAGHLLTSDEKAELLGLRKEVKQLRMEKEILKNRPLFCPAP